MQWFFSRCQVVLRSKRLLWFDRFSPAPTALGAPARCWLGLAFAKRLLRPPLLRRFVLAPVKQIAAPVPRRPPGPPPGQQQGTPRSASCIFIHSDVFNTRIDGRLPMGLTLESKSMLCVAPFFGVAFHRKQDEIWLKLFWQRCSAGLVLLFKFEPSCSYTN